VPATLQALVALVLGVLPGAIYLWGFEREAGKWGIGLSDELLRFVAASAVFLAIYAAPLYVLYHDYLHHYAGLRSGRTLYSDKLTDGHVPLGVMIVVPIAYILIPAILGSVTGVGVRRPAGTRLRRLARYLAGRDPAPRAWEALFTSNPVGAIRARLKSDGSWIGGRIGRRSYAAGYPEVPQDLLLEATYKMEPGGAFSATPSGEPVEIGSQLLVRWDEIDVLEYFPARPIES
jgi:hypothetical protein